MANLDPNQKISLTIKKPEQTVFDGFVRAVSSVSNKGKFDVLGYHTNFIALIKDQITIYEDGKEPQIVPVDSGVMKVSGNKIKVILGVESKKPNPKP